MVERLLLDACLVINLWAGDILRSLAVDCGTELLVVEQVAAEVLYVDSDPDEDRERLNWTELSDSGVIQRIRLAGTEEVTAFLGLIPRLGDGEAASLTAAQHRGLVLGTDDGLALRAASERTSPVETVTTPEVVSWWADAAQADDRIAADVIERIETRASYRPPAQHPLRPWWSALRDCSA